MGVFTDMDILQIWFEIWFPIILILKSRWPCTYWFWKLWGFFIKLGLHHWKPRCFNAKGLAKEHGLYSRTLICSSFWFVAWYLRFRWFPPHMSQASLDFTVAYSLEKIQTFMLQKQSVVLAYLKCIFYYGSSLFDEYSIRWPLNSIFWYLIHHF